MLGINRSDRATSGVGSPEATDHSRRIHNMVRYGVVAEVNYSTATLRADLQDGELRSDWIPWITMRAGQDQVWDPPSVGEVVLLLSSSGELANAVALPAVFSSGNQNGDRAGLHRRTFQDGTVVEYDRQAHVLTVDASASDSQVVFKAKKIRLRTAEISVDAMTSGDMPEASIAVKRVTVEADELISLSAPQIRLNPGA